MYLCDKNHKEICFEEYVCPLCDLNDICDRQERQIEKLQNRIKELENKDDYGNKP